MSIRCPSCDETRWREAFTAWVPMGPTIERRRASGAVARMEVDAR